jgi:dTDP-4-dehydrorhamnose reductase
MRVLVTGASGLLGLNLALSAAESAEKHAVFGVVNHHPLNTRAFTVLPADLALPGAVERLVDQVQPDWIIHCAALAEVDACESDPVRARQLNTQLPERLAEVVARGGARLVHISTDAVFDGARGGYHEDDAPNPLSVYARTKLEGERAVATANPQAIIARVNLFGWSLTGRRSLGEFFFNNLSAGRRVNGFTDVFFCPLLANHLGAILIEMLEKDLHGLYHVVSRECVSKYEFGVRIARRFDLDEGLITPVSVEKAGLKAARSPNLSLSTQKLTQALGAPPPDIDTGLQAFYQLYRKGYLQRIQQMSGSIDIG